MFRHVFPGPSRQSAEQGRSCPEPGKTGGSPPAGKSPIGHKPKSGRDAGLSAPRPRRHRNRRTDRSQAGQPRSPPASSSPRPNRIVRTRRSHRFRACRFSRYRSPGPGDTHVPLAAETTANTSDRFNDLARFVQVRSPLRDQQSRKSLYLDSISINEYEQLSCFPHLFENRGALRFQDRDDLD